MGSKKWSASVSNLRLDPYLCFEAKHVLNRNLRQESVSLKKSSLVLVGSCKLIERCFLQNCSVCPGACRTRCCAMLWSTLAGQCVPPPVVLFILRSLSSLSGFIAREESHTDVSSSDDGSPSYWHGLLLICHQATSGRQATLPFGYSEVHLSIFSAHQEVLSLLF